MVGRRLPPSRDDIICPKIGMLRYRPSLQILVPLYSWSASGGSAGAFALRGRSICLVEITSLNLQDDPGLAITF